jgi:hypothetical protein
VSICDGKCLRVMRRFFIHSVSSLLLLNMDGFEGPVLFLVFVPVSTKKTHT